MNVCCFISEHHLLLRPPGHHPQHRHTPTKKLFGYWHKEKRGWLKAFLLLLWRTDVTSCPIIIPKHPLQTIDSVMFTASRLNTFTLDKRFSSSFDKAMFCVFCCVVFGCCCCCCFHSDALRCWQTQPKIPQKNWTLVRWGHNERSETRQKKSNKIKQMGLFSSKCQNKRQTQVNVVKEMVICIKLHWGIKHVCSLTTFIFAYWFK